MPRPASRVVRRPVFAFVALGLLLLALAAPAAAAPPHLVGWHRLNPDPGNPAPEHEQLRCLPGVTWVCRYDKVPEPGLGFHWDRTIGMFHGRDVTGSWSCPAWLGDVCDETEQVVSGVMNFSPDDSPAFRVRNELILTTGDGVAPLYVLWPDFGFACPWYGSFADALGASPDCIMSS